VVEHRQLATAEVLDPDPVRFRPSACRHMLFALTSWWTMPLAVDHEVNAAIGQLVQVTV
jgi:hypothetical protein